MDWLEPMQNECNDTNTENDGIDLSNFQILDHLRLSDFMTFATTNPLNQFDEDGDTIPAITFTVNVSINFYSSEHEAVTDLAVWQNGQIKKINQTISPAKRFFRIGTTEVLISI